MKTWNCELRGGPEILIDQNIFFDRGETFQTILRTFSTTPEKFRAETETHRSDPNRAAPN